MPPSQAAASVASASASVTLVKSSPSGAPPKPICGSMTFERPSFLSLKGSILSLFSKREKKPIGSGGWRSISCCCLKAVGEFVDLPLDDRDDREAGGAVAKPRSAGEGG